jgi:hypothetical protein
LKRSLVSLSAGKYKLLSKSADGWTLLPPQSSHPFRFKINSVQLKETPAESSATSETVIKDRSVALDTAIVRIMKSEKKLGHSQLVAKVFGALKFPISASDVKLRIESLIERYIERVDSFYQYLA